MKNTLLVSVVSAVLIIGLTGCAQKPQSANSSEAIQQSKELKTVEEQARYLVKEANAFVSSKEFDQAINVAKYVLSNLDKDSQEAKNILEKAQAELKAYAAQKAEEMKGDLQKKLGSFGQ